MIHVAFNSDKSHHEWPTKCVLLDFQKEGRSGPSVIVRATEEEIVFYYKGKEVKRIVLSELIDSK